MPEIYKPRKIIKDYEIVEHLGSGNYAASYQALDTRNGKKVFFKQYIDPTDFLEEEFKNFITAQRRFAELISEVDEGETILDTFEIDGIHYQAKEWMDGEDLRNYFSKKALSYEERCLIAVVCIWGLVKLHEKNIIHNDLKPEQIFLKEDSLLKLKYQVKITDFDFSSIDGEFEAIYKVTTPYYTSPEYFKNEKRTKMSDVFTLGVILYEILCGDDPYEVTDEEEYEEKVLKYDAKRASQLNPIISEKLSDLLLKTLDPDASQRPSLKSIHEALLEPEKPAVPIRVELNSKESPIQPAVHKNSVIGREWLRVFPSYRFVSKEQFELIKGETGWRIRGIEGVVNDTYLDGENITGKDRDLVDGSEILVGNKETRNGLILSIKFIEE